MNAKGPLVRIFHTEITAEIERDRLDEYMALLCTEVQASISQYYKWQDRYRSLFGKLLLRTALQSYGLDPGDLSYIIKNDYGRPYTDRGVEFNISHSGSQVICAVSTDTKLGIDIEQIKNIDLNEFNATMTANQWQHIFADKNPISAFFRLWALKESVIKADGRGLSVPLTELETDFVNIKYESILWYLTPVNAPDDYAAFLATDVPDPQLEFLKVNF